MRGDEGPLFRAAFEKLKEATGNSPAKLEEIWESREDLQALCDQINRYHRTFDLAEEWTAVAFTPHVDPASAKARREYDADWDRIVGRIASREFLKLLDGLLDGLDGLAASENHRLELREEIEAWRAGGKADARSLTYAFGCLADQRANDDSGDFEWIEEAIDSWTKLTKVVGLDVKSAFWRRRAIPHILFPIHVSNRYGQNRASIYRRLHDAARAFTFGAPLAALAMQRAVLEELLTKHWGSPKGYIREANLPELSHDSRADRLKRLGNAALHGEPEMLDPDGLDFEIIKNFLLLRELIETAPLIMGRAEN